MLLACLAFILQNEGVTWWEMRWKKQVPNTKSKVIFLNVYLLLNFSFHLEFLGRTLCQTGKDDIACFEGILENIQDQLKKYFQTVFGKRRDFKLSLSFCTMRNQVFSCENGSNKSLAGALLIGRPDQGSKLCEELVLLGILFCACGSHHKY